MYLQEIAVPVEIPDELYQVLADFFAVGFLQHQQDQLYQPLLFDQLHLPMLQIVFLHLILFDVAVLLLVVHFERQLIILVLVYHQVFQQDFSLPLLQQVLVLYLQMIQHLQPVLLYLVLQLLHLVELLF